MKTKRIILIISIIVMIGLMMVYSASHIWAYYKFNDHYYYFKRQALFAILGIVMMFIFSKIDYHLYQKHSITILLGSLVLLGLVLIPGVGVVRGGSRSWFNFGLFALQPSEIYKIAMIIYVSDYLAHHYHQMKKVKTAFKLVFMNLIGFGLIMLQPDFGSGLVIICSVALMVMVSPFLFRYFLSVGLIGLAGMVTMILSASYRLKRITAYLNPFADPLGSGFQMIQSLYSIAPGGILGVGFDHSIQKHFYLPEPQTDFIFAIYLEEFGLIGGMFLVLLYTCFFVYCFTLAKYVDDLFGSFLMLGIVFMIGIQTFMNLGVVVGLLPVTGVMYF